MPDAKTKLLNYETKVPAERTMQEIIGILRQHGARDFGLRYAEDGQPDGLRWVLPTREYGNLPFALPCNAESVFRILSDMRVQVRDVERRRERAYMVAWRILKDWVEAQMALIQTGMVDVTEVFMPYMLTDQGITLYDHLESQRFRGLETRGGGIALPGRSD